MSSSDRKARDRAFGAEAKAAKGAGKAPAAPKGQFESGLYMTATPIGHARDITLRALDVLQGADVVAAEDTRVTAKLFALHGIGTKLISYRAENAARATPVILARLRRGEAVALVTDAGTPHVSDPGAELAAAVAADGHKVFAVPGASALTAALSVSGLTASRTLFAGFLPAQRSARQAELAELKTMNAALVFFEAPHRVVETLHDMAAILGAERPAVVCREITKRHEETRRGTLAELAAGVDDNITRGEIVLVIGPPALKDSYADSHDLDSALTQALASMRVKDAADAVAGALGLPRRTVYARALELKAGG